MGSRTMSDKWEWVMINKLLSSAAALQSLFCSQCYFYINRIMKDRFETI